MSDPYTTGRYAAHNPDWHEADAPDKARGIASVLRYGGVMPRTVVDVGCGSGAVLAALRDAFETDLPNTVWEGWDIASDAIRRARLREGNRLAYVCADFLTSERRADLLLCIDVVEHVPDDVAFLEALRDRADWFVFRIPLDLSVLDVLRPKRLLATREHYGHRHFYTREMATDLLRAAGYRLETMRYDRMPARKDTPRRRVAEWVRRLAFDARPEGAVRWLGGFSLLVLARRGRP